MTATVIRLSDRYCRTARERMTEQLLREVGVTQDSTDRMRNWFAVHIAVEEWQRDFPAECWSDPAFRAHFAGRGL